MKQRVKVSLKICIQVYMHLSLGQFMETLTILVMNHIYNRQMSYKTGVITCRSSIDGIPLAEKLSTLSEDFEQIKNNNTDNLDATTKCFLKAISTSCKAIGHTEQAAKDVRRRCFAMLDYFGLKSQFLSTTPDNKCSFSLLYCKPLLGEINIFQNGIICLFVMCLQNGMLCLFVISLPVFCVLTLGKINIFQN
jgi:hypothetical protein